MLRNKLNDEMWWEMGSYWTMDIKLIYLYSKMVITSWLFPSIWLCSGCILYFCLNEIYTRNWIWWVGFFLVLDSALLTYLVYDWILHIWIIQIPIFTRFSCGQRITVSIHYLPGFFCSIRKQQLLLTCNIWLVFFF